MSSISSRSLSMSSLIFLPFLASSALPFPPSPPSAGLLGRVSFFFCSAICPSVPRDRAGQPPGTRSPACILADGCTCHAFSTPPELLAERQGLVLVRRA